MLHCLCVLIMCFTTRELLIASVFLAKVVGQVHLTAGKWKGSQTPHSDSQFPSQVQWRSPWLQSWHQQQGSGSSRSSSSSIHFLMITVFSAPDCFCLCSYRKLPPMWFIALAFSGVLMLLSRCSAAKWLIELRKYRIVLCHLLQYLTRSLTAALSDLKLAVVTVGMKQPGHA